MKPNWCERQVVATGKARRQLPVPVAAAVVAAFFFCPFLDDNSSGYTHTQTLARQWQLLLYFGSHWGTVVAAVTAGNKLCLEAPQRSQQELLIANSDRESIWDNNA